MKKVTVIQAITLFLGVFFLTTSLYQCRKTGDLIKDLNRAYTGGADSSLFSSFYDNTTVAEADLTPEVNDVIKVRGVQTMVREYCNTGNCHGGRVNPRFETYADIMKYVVAGNPEGSKLWEFVTTNDYDKAMPPVNSNHELGTTDKAILYNWIRNGAKEKPDLADYRPAAIRIINDGCGSANCHNQATATGGWARGGLLGTLTTADTTTYLYTNPVSGSITSYCLISNSTLRNTVWNAYKDSVRKFYSDTLANNSFRPWKKFSTPRSAASTRGPLQTYDDILLDVYYPKGQRSSNSILYTNPSTLVTYYVSGNPLNTASAMISRVDSTILVANPYTGVYSSSQQGGMAYDDGGLKPSEIAIIKAWYFADPNIPSVWKYGPTGAGIFKYRKTGNIILP